MHVLAQALHRDPTEDDLSFVYSTWLKCHRQNSQWARGIPASIYFQNHKHVIRRVLDEAGTIIACNPEDHGQIFGYGVYQPTTGGVAVVHFIYVKHTYRRLGIGTAILRAILHATDHNAELPAVATHETRMLETVSDKWNLVYNPYVLAAEYYHDSSFKPSQAGQRD